MHVLNAVMPTETRLQKISKKKKKKQWVIRKYLNFLLWFPHWRRLLKKILSGNLICKKIDGKICSTDSKLNKVIASSPEALETANEAKENAKAAELKVKEMQDELISVKLDWDDVLKKWINLRPS